MDKIDMRADPIATFVHIVVKVAKDYGWIAEVVAQPNVDATTIRLSPLEGARPFQITLREPVGNVPMDVTASGRELRLANDPERMFRLVQRCIMTAWSIREKMRNDG